MVTFLEPRYETLLYKIEITKEFRDNALDGDMIFSIRTFSFAAAIALLSAGTKPPKSRSMLRIDDTITCIWGTRMITDAPPKMDADYLNKLKEAQL